MCYTYEIFMYLFCGLNLEELWLNNNAVHNHDDMGLSLTTNISWECKIKHIFSLPEVQLKSFTRHLPHPEFALAGFHVQNGSKTRIFLSVYQLTIVWNGIS